MQRLWFGIIVVGLVAVAGRAAGDADFPSAAKGPIRRYPLREEAPGRHDGAGYNQWMDRASLVFPRAHQMAVAFERGGETRCYLFGGKASPDGAMTAAVLEYDVGRDTWVERSPMPTARGVGGAVRVKDLIYVIGGCRTPGTGLDVVEVYDPVRDSWRSAQPMPVPNHDFGTGVWRDSLIYVIGGGNWSSAPVASVCVYDPANDRWSCATPLPARMGALGAGIIGDTVVVTTGFQESAVNATFVGAINPADPTLIVWSQGPACPGELRCRTACGVFGDELFLVGGNLIAGGVTSEVRSYNPRTNVWSRWADKPVPVANVFGIAVGADSVLYVAGGFPWTFPYARTNEGLDLRPFEHDCGIVRVIPDGRVRPGQQLAFQAVLKNYGRKWEEFACHWVVTDSIAGRTLRAGRTRVALDPGEMLRIELGSVAASEKIYTVAVNTALSGDENAANDTMRARVEARIGSRPDGFGYTCQSSQEPDTIGCDWIDATRGAAISGWFPNADDGYVRRRLPFKFRYYGQDLDEVTVCTNGCLETDTFRFHFNESLPGRGQNRIAVWWDDLDLRQAGTVWQYDDPLGQYAVFAWDGVPRFRYPEECETFEAVLYRSGTIRFNYRRLRGDLASNTIGIQGKLGAGGWFQRYVFNGFPASHIVADSVSVVFVPPEVWASEAPALTTKQPGWQLPAPCRQDALVLPEWLNQGTAQLFDRTGKLVRAKTVHRQGEALLLQGLSAGIYFVRVKGPDHIETAKLLIVGGR
jgi:hypothetical protein